VSRERDEWHNDHGTSFRTPWEMAGAGREQEDRRPSAWKGTRDRLLYHGEASRNTETGHSEAHLCGQIAEISTSG
jgi:hypothetical protein